MAKLLPPSKSSKSSIVKADKFLNFSKPSAKITKTSSITDTVKKIENKVIKVDKLLKDSLLLSKKEDKKTRVKKEGEEFSEREKELEKKLPKPEKEVKLPSAPKLGFFGWIKNFITQTVLGFLAVRLIGFLPQLLKILPVIINVSDFIIDWGGKLLDGLVTFIDWGYKTYDATRGFVKNLFGDGGVKKFDELSDVLNKFLNLAIIAGMVAAGSGGFGGGGKGASPKISGTPKVTTSGGAAGRPDIRNPLRQRPTITTSGGGAAGRLDLRNPLRQRPTITTGGGGKRALLSSVRPFLKRIPLPVVGALIDFGLSVALGESPGRAAFRAIGAGLLGALGAVIGSVVPVAGNFIGGMIGGVAGDLAGGALYDLFFGGKTPKKGKVNKLAGGGIPKTSRSKTVRRTLKKKKPKRTVSFIPRKIKPGANTGGEEKVRKVFPNPEKSWWDPFGLFTGKSKEQPQETKKPTQKTTNPQEFLVKSNDDLGRADFFGPFFTIALKSVLGQKPDLLDYRNAGKGLNSWIQTTFKSGVLGFAGGGEVDAQKYFEGEDYTNIIAKTVEDSVSKEVDTTIRNLSKELSLRPVGREEMLEKNNQGVEEGTEGADGFSEGGISGTGVNKAVSVAKKLIADLGITPAQAAGIVGNFLYESAGMNPAEREGEPYGIPEKPPAMGTLRVGYGWAQWTNSAPGDRLDKFLKSYGGDKGKIATDDDNYRFLMTELKGSESLNKKGVVTKTFFPKDDPQAASDWFRVNWERAGVPADAKRRRETMKVYEKIKGLSREQAKADVAKSGGKILQATDGKMGPGHGSEGVKIAGDLGDFMKANRRKIPVTGSIWQHPRHPPFERRSGDSYHNSGRAIDLGGYSPSTPGNGGKDEQAPVIRALLEWNKKMGVKPVELIHGSPAFKNIGDYRTYPDVHHHHVHVAYAEGGETLDGPHIAMIGEEGTEYVINNKSYEETERVAPGLLDILNYDVHDRNSLKKYMPSIINSLTTYMDYEQPYAEPEFFEVPVVIEVPVPLGGEGGTSITMMRDIDNSVPGMDILDAIG
jgi:hypothetical protein